MTGRQAPRTLIPALLQRIEGAQCADWTLHDWHSATFSGARLNMLIALEGDDAAARLSALANALPDIEFNLPGMFVADIMAHAVEPSKGSARLSIEALVLRDIA
jgi:hypothetical protein